MPCCKLHSLNLHFVARSVGPIHSHKQHVRTGAAAVDTKRVLAAQHGMCETWTVGQTLTSVRAELYGDLTAVTSAIGE